ncbi:hypothetical protein BU23DRAFT_563466 [Bimuria novae-zelandiae CBS 107.79]|uniref:Uncharacterized protein n=1 Tax=Bimuria novae-zelandiae CBS 107.79 TaxID=1447943 RepID=A0A6A5VNF5_9PLEO|nr:hypothetical protein BU23DRAFT_563466 [Bimuria novae-zelandiae CBS 107.79]
MYDPEEMEKHIAHRPSPPIVCLQFIKVEPPHLQFIDAWSETTGDTVLLRISDGMIDLDSLLQFLFNGCMSYPREAAIATRAALWKFSSHDWKPDRETYINADRLQQLARLIDFECLYEPMLDAARAITAQRNWVTVTMCHSCTTLLNRRSMRNHLRDSHYWRRVNKKIGGCI